MEGGGGSLETNGLQISCLNFENHSTLHLRRKCFRKTHPRSILSMEMFTCCCCYTGAPWPPFLCTRCSLLPMWKLHCIRCSRRWCQTLGVQERNSGNASISSVLKQVFTYLQQENALLEKNFKKPYMFICCKSPFFWRLETCEVIHCQSTSWPSVQPEETSSLSAMTIKSRYRISSPWCIILSDGEFTLWKI